MGVIPDSSWQDRNEVLSALPKALSNDRMVQVRTPQIKQRSNLVSTIYQPLAELMFKYRPEAGE